MDTDGLKGIKGTSTFCDQGRDMVVECEGVTDTYTKYVYVFILSTRLIPGVAEGYERDLFLRGR